MLTAYDKPWLSRAIKKSIKIRNKIYKQYCKEKHQAKKELLHEKELLKKSFYSLKKTKTKSLLYQELERALSERATAANISKKIKSTK